MTLISRRLICRSNHHTPMRTRVINMCTHAITIHICVYIHSPYTYAYTCNQYVYTWYHHTCMRIYSITTHIYVQMQSSYTYVYKSNHHTHMCTNAIIIHICVQIQSPYTYVYTSNHHTHMCTNTITIHICVGETGSSCYTGKLLQR